MRSPLRAEDQDHFNERCGSKRSSRWASDPPFEEQMSLGNAACREAPQTDHEFHDVVDLTRYLFMINDSSLFILSIMLSCSITD
jgi:hypothetical protein